MVHASYRIQTVRSCRIDADDHACACALCGLEAQQRVLHDDGFFRRGPDFFEALQIDIRFRLAG